MSLPRLTMPSINLHAKHPTTNEAMKPAARGAVPIDENTTSPFTTLSSISPSIGANTIRNEKRATALFSAPPIIPVAIVEPERDSPGIAATPWAIPIAMALPYDTPFELLLLAFEAKRSSRAVSSNIAPTIVRM